MPPPRETRLDDQLARQLYEQSSELLVQGRYADAADRLRAALSMEPGLISARLDLAGIQYVQGHLAAAVESYAQVLQKDPRQPDALRGSALAMAGQRRYADAVAMLERLLELDRHDAQVWLELGDVLYLSGDAAAARERWTRAAEVDDSATGIIEKARVRLKVYAATQRRFSR